jgi:hypothetical protein
MDVSDICGGGHSRAGILYGSSGVRRLMSAESVAVLGNDGYNGHIMNI